MRGARPFEKAWTPMCVFKRRDLMCVFDIGYINICSCGRIKCCFH